MTSTAANRLTTAALVLDAHAAGSFHTIDASKAFARGWDIEGAEARFFEWNGGEAIGNSTTGLIEIATATGDLFTLNPATGEIASA